MFLKAVADALDEKPHRLAAHLDEALDPQHVDGAPRYRPTGQARHRYLDRANFENGAVEIVVIVLGQSVVVRGPCGKIVLGGGIEAKQDG